MRSSSTFASTSRSTQASWRPSTAPRLRASRSSGRTPYDRPDGAHPARLTLRFAADSADLTPQIHRFELFNRSQLFPWVARAGHPSVATGDFHRLEHLDGWKTLIPCEHNAEEVVSYLRSSGPVYLARFDISVTRVAA